MKINLKEIPFVVVDLYSGGYVTTHKNGHECFNLQENNGMYYGYCPPGSNIDICRLGAGEKDDSVEEIMVVYTTKLLNSNDRYIVAFCKKATAYRKKQNGKLLKRKIIIGGKTDYCDYSVESDNMCIIDSSYNKFIITPSDEDTTNRFRGQRFFKGKYKDLDSKIINYLEEYLNLSDNTDDQIFQNEIQNIGVTKALPSDSEDKLIFTDSPNGRQVKKRARISKAALKKANFICAGDVNHTTFSTKKGDQYMEGHHLIPCTCSNAEYFKDEYGVNIDCIENIVCLCPTCHRLIHFGSESARNLLIKKLYNIQSSELSKIGVNIGPKDLIKLYK